MLVTLYVLAVGALVVVIWRQAGKADRAHQELERRRQMAEMERPSTHWNA